MPSPDLATSTEAGADLDRSRLRGVLIGLCVAEIVSWGILHYAFAVAAPSISADTGWSPTLLIFVAGWLLAGVAMAGVLYQPAFAALTRWYGPRRLRALTAVTLVVGHGIATLLQATAVTDRWGSRAYGRLSGILAAPVTAVSALAPWVGATLAVILGGYPAMFAVLAAIAVAGVLLLGFGVPRVAERSPNRS